MKHPLLTRHITTLFAVTALAAAGLVLTSGVALAQTTKTFKGHFHSSDGKTGFFVETVSTDNDTKTDTVVYTLRSNGETSTDIKATTPDTAGAAPYTVSFSHTDFGSTAQFTSNKTVDKVKGGFVGTGTYTDATGVSGTLTSLETMVNNMHVDSSAYTPTAAGKGINELRVEDDALGFVVVKKLTLLADGSTTSVIVTRYITE